MKSAGAKFVWTLHNKKPHDLKNSKLAEEFRNFLLKECDRIVIHSINSKEFLKKIMGKEIENKIFYIPHGNYIKNYNIAVSNLRDKYNLMKSDFVFLYFGIIRPYKNLSVLIEVFKQLKLKRAKLLICGNPLNGKIENEIKSLCKDKNIILDMRFIKEQEVNRLFKTSDVVVLPYDKTSVLNSGTVLLSYSLKTPVIIPEIASIKSIKSNSFIFSYDYKNSNEHYRNLKKILRQTYKRYYSNRENLKIKGEKGYKFVKENNNWEIIEKRIGKLYNSLI
jgi:glycosyltransferase involved in cell wall biosynthesis